MLLKFFSAKKIIELFLCYPPKINQQMSNKFVLMNQAVEQIRNKVQKALNEGRTFTRVEPDADQYTPCCKMEGLKEDPRFPNVSTSTECL